MGKRIITSKEAISLLNNDKRIHTFRKCIYDGAGLLMGCDWNKKDIIKAIKKHSDKLELGGKTCRSMKHGLILEDDSGYLFIETNENKLNEFDPQEINDLKS